MCYPMKLLPSTVQTVWGGTRLMGKWNKCSEGENIAESWELSCHEKGESKVINGEYANCTLSKVIKQNPEFVGERGKAFDFFPVLIKFIDSKDDLSIQVHPSDEYALKNEGEFGKTEMWYVVECDKGSGVYCGFKEPIDKSTLEKALNDGNITDYLNYIEVKKGDCLFIPSGTVHAICGGLLICEVQQNSSLTYRLFDYNRTDKQGNRRELHIDKALQVTDTSKVVKVNENSVKIDDNALRLAQCKYFTVEELTTKDEYSFEVDGSTFVSLTVIGGKGAVMANGSCITLDLGDTVFLPANVGKVDIYGDIKCIKAYV
ncbi:MAG: class I mannose-6-phosphate isomerase [Clostridia bacterium]|nr:class I mannose-6-phosphate isomerase [Clostridia bacterium]